MFKNLIAKLWNDEAGAVIATEYLMLGSLVAMGGASGMVAMRDSVVEEYTEYGNSVREVRQAYTPPARGNRAAHTDAAKSNVPTASQGQNITFSHPTP